MEIMDGGTNDRAINSMTLAVCTQNSVLLLCFLHKTNALPYPLAGLRRRRHVFVVEFHQQQKPSIFPVFSVPDETEGPSERNDSR